MIVRYNIPGTFCSEWWKNGVFYSELAWFCRRGGGGRWLGGPYVSIEKKAQLPAAKRGNKEFFELVACFCFFFFYTPRIARVCSSFLCVGGCRDRRGSSHTALAFAVSSEESCAIGKR